MTTSSCFHVTQVEEIKRIVGEGLYEREIVGPDGSPVSGGSQLAGESSALVKASKLMLDYANSATTFGYTTATPAIDAAFVRYSNAVRRLDLTGNTAQIRRGSASLTADPADQMLSLWVYLPFHPVGGASGHSIAVGVSNEAANGSNLITFSFDSSYLR